MTGLGTVAMMALTARSLPAAQYAAFAVWWTMAVLLGTSFGVFEAYLARLVVTEVAAGRTPTPATGLMIGRALLVVLAVTCLVLPMSPWLGDRLFAGHTGAALLLPLFTAAAATQALQRGAATGRRRFGAIAGQLATDGVLRIALVAALVAAGADTVTSLALVCCLAAAASLVVGSALCRSWWAAPRLRGREAAIRPLLFLLAGSVGPLLANNGSVPWLANTHDVGTYTLGAFAGAITLSRIPTQFISAAFSPLLAHLSHAIDVGDETTFRHLRRRAIITATTLGVVYVFVFAALGPALLTAYLGPRYHLGVGYLAALAAASSVMFVGVVQQAGLAALDRWSSIAVAWGAGTGAFLSVLALPGDALLRASLAPLGAVLVAVVLLMATRIHLVGRVDAASG